jgi:hypothetical protein
MSFPALKEAQGRLDAKRDEVHSIFNEAGPELDLSKVKSVSGVADAKGVAAHIRALNDEMGDLQKEVDDLMAVQKAVEDSTKSAERRENGSENGDHAGPPQVKSAGQLFVESDSYKRLYSYEGIGRKSRNGSLVGPESMLDVELKTVMSTGAGWAPQAVRTDVVVPSAQRPIQVTDLIPSLSTTQSSVVFMEETTFTNSAAETLESVQGTPAPIRSRRWCSPSGRRRYGRSPPSCRSPMSSWRTFPARSSTSTRGCRSWFSSASTARSCPATVARPTCAAWSTWWASPPRPAAPTPPPTPS